MKYVYIYRVRYKTDLSFSIRYTVPSSTSLLKTSTFTWSSDRGQLNQHTPFNWQQPLWNGYYLKIDRIHLHSTQVPAEIESLREKICSPSSPFLKLLMQTKERVWKLQTNTLLVSFLRVISAQKKSYIPSYLPNYLETNFKFIQYKILLIFIVSSCS